MGKQTMITAQVKNTGLSMWIAVEMAKDGQRYAFAAKNVAWGSWNFAPGLPAIFIRTGTKAGTKLELRETRHDAAGQVACWVYSNEQVTVYAWNH